MKRNHSVSMTINNNIVSEEGNSSVSAAPEMCLMKPNSLILSAAQSNCSGSGNAQIQRPRKMFYLTKRNFPIAAIANSHQIKRNSSVSNPPRKKLSEEVAIKNCISDQAEVFALIGSLNLFCLQPTDVRMITT